MSISERIVCQSPLYGPTDPYQKPEGDLGRGGSTLMGALMHLSTISCWSKLSMTIGRLGHSWPDIVSCHKDGRSSLKAQKNWWVKKIPLVIINTCSSGIILIRGKWIYLQISVNHEFSFKYCFGGDSKPFRRIVGEEFMFHNNRRKKIMDIIKQISLSSTFQVFWLGISLVFSSYVWTFKSI